MQYPRSLAVTWQTTLDRLGAGEIALLRLLAWLAPDPVPMFVLEGEAAEEVWREAIVLFRQESPEHGETAAELRAALVTLANYSLLRWDTQAQTVAVHRVVQEILRTRLPEEWRRYWLILCLCLVDGASPPDPDVRTWPRWNPLRPHVAFVVAEADAAGIGEPTAGLMNKLGVLLNIKALHAEAEPLMRRVVDITEKSMGEGHPNFAAALNNLVQLLHATNRLEEAEPLMRRALEIDERSYGPEHPNVAIRLNSLAQLLQATNRLEAAEPLMRRALQIDERSDGPEHPDVARDLNNLARLLKATNRLQEAEPLSRRMVGIFLDFTRRTGHPHPRLEAAWANYAAILKDLGRSEVEIAAELGALSGEYGIQLRK